MANISDLFFKQKVVNFVPLEAGDYPAVLGGYKLTTNATNTFVELNVVISKKFSRTLRYCTSSATGVELLNQLIVEVAGAKLSPKEGLLALAGKSIKVRVSNKDGFVNVNYLPADTAVADEASVEEIV